MIWERTVPEPTCAMIGELSRSRRYANPSLRIPSADDRFNGQCVQSRVGVIGFALRTGLSGGDFSESTQIVSRRGMQSVPTLADEEQRCERTLRAQLH